MSHQDHTTFGVLDVLRVLGGVLFLNAFLSWWFTSSSTWGYEGKYIDHSYYLHHLSGAVNLTSAELANYNGQVPGNRIYVAVNGSVYDVTSSPSIYGPGGSYHSLSGKDSARVYVTGCFQNSDQFTHDLRGLDDSETFHDITRWQAFFARHPKYWYAGVVHNDDVSANPVPQPCQHTKFPRHG